MYCAYRKRVQVVVDQVVRSRTDQHLSDDHVQAHLSSKPQLIQPPACMQILFNVLYANTNRHAYNIHNRNTHKNHAHIYDYLILNVFMFTINTINVYPFY